MADGFHPKAIPLTERYQQGTVVGLDAELAMEAAGLGLAQKLPLADSIIYATARQHGATLWTQDAHFKGLPGVRYQAV